MTWAPNIYAYTSGNPISRIDPTGLWSPGAHDAILQHAFGGQLSAADVALLQQSSRDFDKSHQSPDESYMHSMSEQGQSPADAVQARDNFIAQTIAAALARALAGDRNGALSLLGQACHPVMDASSPMHTTADGQPKEWNPWHPWSAWGHSPTDYIGNETVHDLTPGILQQQDNALHGLYGQVFGK